VLALLFTAATGSGTSAGDSGIAITVGKIAVSEGLKPGGRYDLPSVGVINTGTKRQAYELTVDYIDGQTEKRPSPRWIEFAPRSFVLDAGEAQTVRIHLELPTGADPGDYFAYIQAQSTNSLDQSIQAAVATKLSFSVKSTNWFDAQKTRINRWLDGASPWPQVLVIASLAAVALRIASKRVRFRLPFEPR
jgi:hypothetical protein